MQHTADNCINETYKYCAESLYRHNNSVNKLIPNNRKRGRPPKGMNCLWDKTVKQFVKQPISMTKQIDKTVSTSMALVTNTAINTQHPVLSDNTMYINPSDFNSCNVLTMDNISDMSNIDSSKLLTTYWLPDIELYNNEQPLLTPDIPINLMHKHIPQQSEVNKFLQNRRTKVLHTTQLLIQTQSLINEYSKLPKFRQIYQCIKNGYIKGLQSIRKWIQLEEQEYVLLNDILCKINNTGSTNQSESDLLIVIPEKYQPMIFHQYHNNILTSHQGAWKTYITMKKNFYFPGMLNKLKQYITACNICQRTQQKRNNNIHMHARIPETYYPMM